MNFSGNVYNVSFIFYSYCLIIPEFYSLPVTYKDTPIQYSVAVFTDIIVNNSMPELAEFMYTIIILCALNFVYVYIYKH